MAYWAGENNIAYTSYMIDHLRKAIDSNSLPYCFSFEAIKNEYNKLKSYLEKTNKRINEKTLELFSVMLQRDKATSPELLDLFSNWEKYSSSKSVDSKHYYFTEALLKLDSKDQEGFFEGIIQK